MKTRISVTAAIVFFVSCTVQPEKMAYGTDACYYCKMNIVDSRHASEIVTRKGKIYKYDAIECMLNDAENNQPDNVAMYLVMDYNVPDTFTDATLATYLISENVSSPMGAFLSAFKEERMAIKTKEEKTGQLFTWEAIRKRFSDVSN